MNRDKLKDIIEGVGFLAVIASLVFVGIETRNGAIQAELNTEAIEMAAYQGLIQSINDMNALAIQEPRLAAAIRKVSAGQTDLDEAERDIFGYWLWMRIRHGDMAYFQYVQGTIDEACLRTAIPPLIDLIRRPYARELWESRQFYLVLEFRAYINGILDEVDKTASTGRFQATSTELNRPVELLAVQPCRVVAVFESTGGKQGGCLGIDPVFDLQDACGQRLRGVIRLHANPSLDNGRTAIEFFCRKMHGAARPFVPGIDRPLVRIQSRVFRQQ